MKKIFSMVWILGLMACADDNQSQANENNQMTTTSVTSEVSDSHQITGTVMAKIDGNQKTFYSNSQVIQLDDKALKAIKQKVAKNKQLKNHQKQAESFVNDMNGRTINSARIYQIKSPVISGMKIPGSDDLIVEISAYASQQRNFSDAENLTVSFKLNPNDLSILTAGKKIRYVPDGKKFMDMYVSERDTVSISINEIQSGEKNQLKLNGEFSAELSFYSVKNEENNEVRTVTGKFEIEKIAVSDEVYQLAKGK